MNENKTRKVFWAVQGKTFFLPVLNHVTITDLRIGEGEMPAVAVKESAVRTVLRMRGECQRHRHDRIKS